jgi:hypothetical protein
MLKQAIAQDAANHREGERRQIDHILLSASIKEVVNGGGTRPRVPGQPNRLASDHRPFVVTLDLR